MSVYEVQCAIEDILNDNHLSSVVAATDGTELYTNLGGYHGYILSCLASLISRMVEDVGEEDTIEAVLEGFKDANVSENKLKEALKGVAK